MPEPHVALSPKGPHGITQESGESSGDLDRYSRQILFPGIAEAGQRRLSQARVAIVGCGATGTVSSTLLARAGVGHISLIDRDFVETSNLQRQILYDETDAREALPKAEAARRKLLAANSSISVEAHITDLVPSNIAALLGTADLILDASDNFETRYLINDFAVQSGTPWIYAAAVGSLAATMTVLPRAPAGTPPPPYQSTACLACIFPEPPSGTGETCDTAGILGTAVMLAASLQVTEAFKILVGDYHAVRRTLFSADLWSPRSGRGLQHAEISSDPRSGCEVCDKRIFRHLAGEHRPQITLCGRNSVQIHEHNRPIDLAALAQKLRQDPGLTNVRSNSLLLRFSRDPHTLTIFPDGRALIQGTTDPAIARSLYARFVGA